MSHGDTIAGAVLNALNHQNRNVRASAIDDASQYADPDELIAAVADQADSLRRNAAIEALARGSKRSVSSLIRALRHDDPEVIMFAAGILGRTRDKSVVPHLAELVSHEEINVAQAAIESLSLLRAAAAVKPIISALDRDPWLRLAGIHALGEIGDPRAAGVLIALLRDEDVRDLAVTALGKIRSADALAHLAEVLQESVESTTFLSCLRAVGAVLERQTNVESLRHLESWTRLGSPAAAPVHLRLLEVLVAEPARAEVEVDELETKIAAVTLIRALRLQSLYTPMVLAGRTPKLRQPLEFSAIALGHEIANSLHVAVSYENRHVRLLACRCAGALRLDKMASRIEALLEDDDAEVREAAVRSLAQMGTDRSVHCLAPLLVDAAEAVREAAREALSGLDAQGVTDALLAHVQRDASYCAAALRVMKANPHEGQLGFVLDCLSATSPEVRCLAIEAIAAQPVFEYVDAVEPFLQDPDPGVREAVIGVLSRRQTRRVRQLLLAQTERDAETRVAAVKALAELGDASITPHLLDLFQRESGRARLAIIEVLAELRDPAAEPLIIQLLVDEDEDVRVVAVESLRRFDTDTSLRHLLAAARDSSTKVRAAVTAALCERSDPAAMQELERLCLDDDNEIATRARHRLEVAG